MESKLQHFKLSSFKIYNMRSILVFILIFSLFSCSNEENESIEVGSLELDSANYNVALLVMDGTYNTELTAPMDIFHHSIFRDSIKAMNVFTIANTLDLVTTFEGLRIKPDFDYTQDFPKIDILVIPAGEHNLDSDLRDSVLIQFIQKVDKTATYMISHCDGAFVLAKTGLLDKRASTTFPGDIEAYKMLYPHLDVRDGVMFVQDGKYITSAGGAKSFEASLYLCELLYGKQVADELASGMVISWDKSSVSHVVIEAI